MTKEELQSKIELIEENIKFHKEFMEFDKKTNKSMIILMVLFFIILLLSNTLIDKNIGFLDVFSISLFTATSYNFVQKMLEKNLDNKFKLEKLELDLKYYKAMLNEEAKENK